MHLDPRDTRHVVWLLVAGIAALFVGPLLVWAAGPRASLLSALDGFVVVTLGGLVLFHLFPEAVNATGGAAALATVLGVALPSLSLRFAPKGGPFRDTVALVALVGLALHAALDGAGLAIEAAPHDHHDHGQGGLLGLAIILHQLPVGLGIWWIVSRGRNVRRAAIILAATVIATCFGFFASKPLLEVMTGDSVAIAQALLAGLLLHVVFAHRPDVPGIDGPRAARFATLGAALGAGVLLFAGEDHPMWRAAGELAATSTFFTLALESAPMLLASLVATGLMVGLLGEPSRRALAGPGVAAQTLRGLVFGVRRELCSCDVVPMYGGLIRSSVPAAAGLSFLAATPQLGLDAVLLSFPLLGGNLAVARAAGAALVAVIVAVIVSRSMPHDAHAHAHDHDHDHDHAPPPADSLPERAAHRATPALARLRRGLAFGFGEMFDHSGPWIAAGLFLAAVAEPLLEPGALSQLPVALQIAIMAALAIPPYVCASGALPLIAVLVHKGLDPGAALAFLLIGPATNLVTFRFLRSLHGRRVAIGYTASVVLVAGALSAAASRWMPSAAIPWHELAGDAASPVHVACLAVLGAVLFGSLLRQGPRGFVAQLTLSIAEHDHGPEHDHAHHHAH